jgi:MFS family permease
MDNSSLRIPVIREEIHWPALIAAVAAITAVGIAIGLGLPLLSIILEKRGVSSSMIGLNSAMAGVAAMVAAPLSTMIAQRLTVVTTMVLSIVAASVSALGFYYAEALWMWFPLRIVFHGAITILFVLSEFWINTAAPPSRRGLVFGIYATVLSLGFAAGPLIFSVIGSEGILPFLIGAGIILLAAVPIIMARKENPAIDTPPDLPFLRYVFLVPTATAAVFIFGAVESGGLSLFPVYANRTGFTESQGALLLMMMGLGNVLFQIPIGLIADRMKDRRPLLSLFAIYRTGWIAGPALPDPRLAAYRSHPAVLGWQCCRPLHRRAGASGRQAAWFGSRSGQCRLRFLLRAGDAGGSANHRGLDGCGRQSRLRMGACVLFRDLCSADTVSYCPASKTDLTFPAAFVVSAQVSPWSLERCPRLHF